MVRSGEPAGAAGLTIIPWEGGCSNRVGPNDASTEMTLPVATLGFT